GATAITPPMLTLVQLDQAAIDGIVAGVEGGAANVQDIYPLAPLQEGILFHHLMEKEGDPYLLPSLYSFASREALESFAQAIQQVMDRHDVLRTSIAWDGLPQPVQVVHRKVHLPLSFETLDPRDGDVAEQLEARYDPRHLRLDVGRAPLLRCHAAHDPANGRWLLRLLAHHLAIDHTTLELLAKEAQLIEQGWTDLLSSPAPFRNFVAQARLGVSQEEHEAFFRQMLGDIDEPTAPFGLLDVQGDGTGIDESSLLLSAPLSQALRGQARRLGLSVATLVHLAWALVLARCTGRQDVVFGTVLFGRMSAGQEADRVFGMFINTLPVRLSIDTRGIAEAAHQVHQLLAQLLRHEHAPLALAQRCSAVEAQVPLFTSLLNFRYTPQSEESVDEASAAAEGDALLLRAEERTNYPLTLAVDDLGEDFMLTAQVQASVGAERVCALMHTALQGMVQALQHAPQQAVRDVEVLPAAEREQVLALGR
ncbi:condensation domain-containing protein, partial [Roseateles flavus]